MLVYTSDSEPGIRRLGAGRGFYYRTPDGGKVTCRETLKRIGELAIPPAYREVWICLLENGHLQATGRDGRERKQYRYHPFWQRQQSEEKYGRLAALGERLPTLRRGIRRDLSNDDDEKRYVLATAVRLIDKLGFRVGNETYLRENGTRGIATLGAANVDLDHDSNEIRIEFTGKGGREIEVQFSDPKLHEALSHCHELPGQRLFSYRGRDGHRVAIGSTDVNEFLAERLGEGVTAKDLRTWRASSAAVESLMRKQVPSDRESEIRDAIRHAADVIRNRYETSRKHYIHPGVLEAYRESGRWGFSRRRSTSVSELTQAESLLLELIR